MIIGALLLTGCAQQELSEQFDEETVEAQALKCVELFNEKDYQTLIDMGDETLQNAITEEKFAEASDPYLEKCGTFSEIEKTIIFGSSNKSTNMEYACVVMIGNYENGKIQFTISFDQDMKLVQFVIK